ncbi:serine phosphatase RsbU (regulator of sigma subunit) [Micromonospora pisi]|uniref:Serine phosphatase RsbU (Regulator of sigma subunit) n=1 Tax=Micromonospora pisi TaxID=589240 RepID=A0A495JT18_9ACTN|nr:SpoIIE family protein phosphatase [Micromonospora pisi]RKR91494.1 serine phosphatase RsbU (regulator of sigma subunit) [Micromonospora pisi]
MPGSVGRVPAPPSRWPGPSPTPGSAAGSEAAAGAGEPSAGPPTETTWAQTPLGPAEEWEPALRSVVDLVLSAPVPMALAFGDELALIYNDGFAELIRDLHPAAFGRPAAEVFAQVWELAGVGEEIEKVYRTGIPYLEREGVLPVDRGRGSDQVDHVVLTRGYSPVRDQHGQIIGLLMVIVETTQVTRRLQRLSELAVALSGTLTLDDVARSALRYALESFDADQVGIAVDDGADWRGVRRIRGELLDEADERLPPLWRSFAADSAAPLVVAAASATPRFWADGRPLLSTAIDRHDEKIRALAVLPLRTPSLGGALAIGYCAAHPWSPAERALLTAAAELVAQAAERARRFENQHGTAQLLQRSMLPEQLPDLPRLRLAARYDAGVDGNAAGGDFYDAFPLSPGRLAVVLGDVAGHDVHAAALMGQVRAALRALALSNPDPAAVLSGLDRLVGSLGTEARRDELFVTVVYGVVEPGAGLMTLASAGHPAPLLRQAPAGVPPTARYLDVPPGAPLGLGGNRPTSTVPFVPGDTLLLFSDGVVERRQQSLSAGFAALAEAIAGASSGDPRTLCAVASRAVAGPTEDDAAVLAVEHALTPSRSASLEMPAEPTAPGRVRQWLTAQLTSWQVPESVIGAAVLCTSELTTNALLHAGTAAQVEIDLSPERLLVSVADQGTRGTVTPTRADTLSSRGRGLGLIEQLSDAWGTDPTVRGSTVWFEILIPEGGPRGNG